MNNIFLIAMIISIIYFGIKFIEMKFVENEPKPLKIIVRDSILVYFSVITGYFLLEQIMPFTQSGGTIVPTSSIPGVTNTTPVFTDTPDF